MIATDRWSLATRVIAAGLALLSILLVIIVLAHHQARVERRRAEVANSVHTGNAIAGMIDEFARNLEASLHALSIAVGNRGPATQGDAGPVLAAVSREAGVLRGLFITDAAGRVAASASGEGIGIDLSTRPYMQTLLGGAATVWGPAVAGIETGRVTATYGRALYAADGAVRGYLVAALYPHDLVLRFRDRIPADAAVTLVDGQGVVLYDSHHPDLSLPQRNISGRTEIQAALAGDATQVDGAAGLFETSPHFGVVVPVRSAQWTVVFLRPLEPFEAQLRRQFMVQAGQVTAAMIAVAAVMTLATRRIARPLRLLAETAGSVARGERTPIAPLGGGPEVAKLATAMHVMSDAVVARQRALEQELRYRQILADMAAAFTAAEHDLQQELRTVARSVSMHVGEGCNVFLLSEDGVWLKPVAIFHPVAELQSLTASSFAREPIRVDESLAGLAVQSGRPVLLDDAIEEGLRLVGPHRVDHFRLVGMRSFAAVRITAHGRTIGALTVWRTTVAPYLPDEVALLQAVADHAAVNIENAQLIEDARGHATAAERAGHLPGGVRVTDGARSAQPAGCGQGHHAARAATDRAPHIQFRHRTVAG